MDISVIRRRLESSRGQQFWRSLEELADSPELAETLRAEFPRQADVWIEQLSRRKFLALMGASLALAGVSGCGVQPPAETIMPYVKQPEQLVLGKPMFYATAMSHAGNVTGLLVESHEGRPTKIEGNPDHPASLGSTDIFAQASILGMYDPDRSQTVITPGRIGSWDEAAEAIRKEMAKQRDKKGAGLRIVTPAIVSPTLADQLDGLLKALPEAKWFGYESARGDGARAGAVLAFGKAVQPRYRFDQAEVIVSLDADFLDPPGNVRYVREFAAGRSVSAAAPDANQVKMNRLYVAESTPTITGSKADHRWGMRAVRVAQFARDLAGLIDAKFRLPRGAKPIEPDYDGYPAEVSWDDALEAIVKDLKSRGGKCLVLAGDRQPAEVHALAHAMNQSLGAVGVTVTYSEPVEFKPANGLTALAELITDMQAGKVEVLLVLGINPAYDAPVDLDFAKALAKVPVSVHWGLHVDETAALCTWHLPAAHELESWSDASTFDGTVTIMQPLIAPLYNGRTMQEVLSMVADPVVRVSHDIVRDYWRKYWSDKKPTGGFREFWETALHDGLVRGTELLATTVTLAADLADKLKRAQPAADAAPAVDKNSHEIVFQPDPTIFDGRWANNGWLQELPKPLTKLTWGNAVLVSPATAEALGLTVTPSGHGGEHGELTVDLVEVDYGGRKLTAPAFILPGQPDGSITLTLGYGRTRAGLVGTGLGFNAAKLRTSKAPWFDQGATIRKTGETTALACTSAHHLVENRGLLRTATLAEFHENPKFAKAAEVVHSREAGTTTVPAQEPEHALPSLYSSDDHKYEGYKWGMAIDLTKCIGCNACMIACQAENNIPVVGQEQVRAGREMHWIRVDRYYRGTLEEPEVHFQPVPCMQCENAPCELVCPVAATVHSAEGLNDMVYNRCVGTRYCSNNCPYKVRRFNFLQFADYTTPSLKLLNNPDVTVRSRGVMEKCTYCVQRITHARIDAEKQDRKIRDGEVLTACQAVCPAQAIVFGDLNDPKSQVAQAKSGPLDYTLLEDQNTRPRTTYLANLRNPNPEIKPAG